MFVMNILTFFTLNNSIFYQALFLLISFLITFLMTIFN